jgi:hypothetical protein
MRNMIPLNIKYYRVDVAAEVAKRVRRNLARRAATEGVSMNRYCVYLLGREFEREPRRH